MLLYTSILISTLCLHADSAKILGIFPMPFFSHQEVFQPIWKELARRGHEVTVITPLPLRQNITNLTEIDISVPSFKALENWDLQKVFGKDQSVIGMYYNIFTGALDLLLAVFEPENVRPYVTGEGKEFDLILYESISVLPVIFGYIYKAPVIGITSLGGSLNLHDSVGNPTHPVISPDMNFQFQEDLTFKERFDSVLFNILYRIMYTYVWEPSCTELARKILKDDTLPSIASLEKNVSLHIFNVNPLMNSVRPNVPAIIEISQIHVKKKKALPRDLKDFLDSSRNGVIYFSLGSSYKVDQMPENVEKLIIESLGELPYNVLWKWKEDNIPNMPKNILTRKWLPQQDILGHPNIKAYITQGGLQSIEEAILNETPMVGMPIFGDQPQNIDKMVKKGVAVSVDYLSMSKEDFKNAILEVASNPTYKENAKKLKLILTDQPIGSLEKAVYWIEYVIRHQGAAHLRSSAIDMPLWKYFCLDVFAVMFIGFFLVFYSIWKIIVFIFRKKLPKVKVN